MPQSVIIEKQPVPLAQGAMGHPHEVPSRHLTCSAAFSHPDVAPLWRAPVSKQKAPAATCFAAASRNQVFGCKHGWMSIDP